MEYIYISSIVSVGAAGSTLQSVVWIELSVAMAIHMSCSMRSDGRTELGHLASVMELQGGPSKR